ncbi:adenylate/guanylate cyclase domain-containing protein [Breznakiellaceae bacterium SP9]
MSNNTKTVIDKVRFPIGFKLVTIITILVLLSLGTITALVSYMVSQDIKLTAEDNNFIMNRRSATEAQTSLAAVRSVSLALLDAINLAGHSLSAPLASVFFERNQDLAVIALIEPGRSPDEVLLNPRFFLSREIDSSLVLSFLQSLTETVERAAGGETVLLNGYPYFGVPSLALFVPWQDGGMKQAAVVVFSPESLNESFSTETSLSYLINGDGDILAHADYELVRAGVNVANRDFIRAMRENKEQRMQSLYTENGVRYFGAFTNLNIAGAAVITVIEYDKAFEGIAATTRRNAYLTAVVLFLSVLFIWFFSKSISGPLRQLTAAAIQIREGKFEISLTVKNRDELGLLEKTFQQMSTALEIFGRFTNREIAVQSMRGEIKPGGFPKHATVFFSDIRSFTEKSENFTKEYGAGASDRIVHWLNEYFTRMVECVEKTGGVVDKFIGDAVMAHWGTAYTAGSPEKDALNGVKAALMMRSALLEMNRNRRADDPTNPPIRIGCGINTGIVTAGQIGSDIRMEYTVIGDPVNLASRTEALNKPLGTDILITEDTWLLVKDRFITEEMPPVTVKGKEKPVRMFAVVNLRAQAGKDQPLPHTLAQVREVLGIEPPDISNVDTGAEEKKYKIGGSE